MAGFEEYRFPTKEAMRSLDDKLNLPSRGDEQDWDIELADAERVSEFLDFYETNELTEEEKYALVCLMLGSYDEALRRGIAAENEWEKLKSILVNDARGFRFIIEYWSLPDVPGDDVFNLTRLMRELQASTHSTSSPPPPQNT
jgi:hypothetical protein